MAYPFFYFYDLDFDASKIMEFASTIPSQEWIGPHIGNYDPNIPIEPHPADGKLWTANSSITNFLECQEISKIANYFTRSKPLFYTMMIKKSIKDYRSHFHPLMQNEYLDRKNRIVRTFDIIVPLQGGFVESPLEAVDTKTNEHFTLVPKGKAFMVPCDPTWHYSWCETVFDYRYTLHLRGKAPITYDIMKRLYHKDV